MVMVACGSSDDKPGGGDKDPSGGAGGENPRGGSSGDGATGGGGRGGGGTGGMGNAGSGGDAGGDTGGTDTGGTGTGGTSGDGGSGADGGTGTDGGTGGGGPTTPEVTFTVSGALDLRPISPRIYGINSSNVACNDSGARFGLCRLGYAPWSTYNWENNASNAGAERCNENNAALGASSTPGAPVTSLLTQADAVDATALVTVSMLGHVAADKQAGSAPPECSGDVTDSGTNYLDTRFKISRARKGAALSTTPDTTDAYVNQDEFVNFVQSTSNGVPLIFALDNQPELWFTVHPAVHPAHLTYAEIVAKTTEYASMIRDTAPAAEIAGYVGYGWNGFVNLQDAPDAAPNTEFIDYFLSRMAAESMTASRRLIDYLDVHWYPEVYVDGERIIVADSTPDVVQARVQAPRSLWDSSYVEGSWITDLVGGGIRLIPRLKQKIANGYPGTKLSISEWNYGGGTHVSGAVAAADVLGIFGREGVDSAAFASFAGNEPFVLGAFRAFRNYDGAGASFGDRSIRATSSDDALASVYGSLSSTNGAAMVLVAINKSDTVVDATIDVTHTSSYTTAEVYRITSSSAVPQRATDLTAANANHFAYAMPPYSVSVVVPKP
jgi:hypothetical protein